MDRLVRENLVSSWAFDVLDTLDSVVRCAIGFLEPIGFDNDYSIFGIHHFSQLYIIMIIFNQMPVI